MELNIKSLTVSVNIKLCCVSTELYSLSHIIRVAGDGADTPIARVHRKAFLTRERSRSKPFWAPSYSIPAFLYPTIPHK